MSTFTFDALPCPAVYVLLDGQAWIKSQQAFDDQVNQLIGAGVSLIQFRDKSLNDRDQVAAGKRLSRLTEGTPAAWIMNDRVDLAIAAGAAGVHLGQDDLSVDAARSMMERGKLVGVSTHSIQQARDAVAEGADYIGVGPVFESRTKQFTHFVGVDLVAAVAKEIVIPAFAIGGIDLDNASKVRDAGLKRVAVSSAVINSAAPDVAVKNMLEMLK
jgi:thiamine-phosphate pyrophosphorylase